MAERPSRLDLARLVSGDLPPTEAAELRARIAASPEDQARLAELQGHAAEFEQVAELQRAALRRRLEAEAATPRRQPSRWWRPLAVLVPVAAAAAVVLVISHRIEPLATPPVEDIAFKGQLAVHVVARRGETQFAVEPGVELAPGDALRFVVTAATPGYLTVFSVDGRGEASPFYPESAPATSAAPLRLERAGQQTLPGSVVLDEAPGPERLFVVFSPRPFERGPVHERARQLCAAGPCQTVSARALGVDGAVQLLTVSKRGGGR